MSRQIVEDVVNGRGEARVAGEQAQIGIETRRRRIVVAGAEMSVAANPTVGFTPRDERQLAVRFQPDDAVKNLHAGILQIARRTNIRCFVDASLQLDHDGDFFLRCRFDQRAHDGRILAGAIERLLDRENVGILRRAFDEAHDGAVGIVRVMQKNVAFPYQFKQRRRTWLEIQFARREGAVFQIWPRGLFVKMKKPREVDGAIDAENLSGREPEIRFEPVNDFLARSGLDFQAHRRTLPAAMNLQVRRFQNAAGFLLFEVEVAIARHAEGGSRKNFVSVVQPLRKGVNDVVQKRILDPVLWRRQAHEARQRTRHRDDSEINL